MDRDSRIYVAGHTGLVGSALDACLRADGHRRILTRRHADLDLTRQREVESFFETERPEYVFLAAARVGGIGANAARPAEFIHSNLAIQANVLHAAHRCGARRVLFFGSSCAYPRDAAQPMREDDLMTGPLEPTSEPYAMAKLAGISMCAAYNRQYGTRFIPVIPATVYGPGDNFHPETSHVLPALLRRFREAMRRISGDGDDTVTVWGTGAARREFLYVDDLARACLLLMRLEEERLQELLRLPVPVINIGTNGEIAIAELARLIGRIVGHRGRLMFDASRPDGAPRKRLDTARLDRLGWRPTVSLEEGIRKTNEWYESVAP
jgi:GDP-L-fucose synthase